MSNPDRKAGATKIHALFEKRASSQYSADGPAPQALLPQPEPWSGTTLLRTQRNVNLVCRLGDRPVFEVFAEIARDHGLANEIATLLSRFAALDPDLVNALDCQDFPPAPLHEVAPQ